ncbi:MAG: hypothetical protein GF333_05665 [Candidatus Omnitrophica bacterium]|nr:hypothetical protein [Candidatus Omnitrophota bacterium]
MRKKTTCIALVVCLCSACGGAPVLADAPPMPDVSLSGTEEEFSQKRSEHFIVYYDPEVSEAAARKISAMAERYYRSITQEFRLIREDLWLWDNRARIYVAKDRGEYLRRFRCQQWSAACVDYRSKKIFTYPSQNDFSGLLLHELTHIIFREYVGHRRLPLWIDEGVATYMEYKNSPSGDRLLRMTEEMVREDAYIPFRRIQAMSRLSKSGRAARRFYAQSYSMIVFLRQFGSHYFKPFLSALKRGESVGDSLGSSYRSLRSIEQFEKAWKRHYQK